MFFKQSPLFQYDYFACYYPTPKEFDCHPIIQTLLEAGKKCFLPVINHNHLQFAEYTLQSKLIPNQFKILEPEIKKIFPPEKLQIVFVPLLAFDLQGNRLGMGAGFYDRTFAFLKQNPPFLWGLAYDFQGMNELPIDDWDVKLNGIITEKKLKEF